jgi:hypothetical protein
MVPGLPLPLSVALKLRLTLPGIVSRSRMHDENPECLSVERLVA